MAAAIVISMPFTIAVKFAAFRRRYQARHGVAPEAHATDGHEAVRMLFDAINRSVRGFPFDA